MRELLKMKGSDWLEEYAKNMKMYTTVKKFQVSKIVMFLKEDYFSPKLHLFNKKYTKNSNIVKTVFYFNILFLWCQIWFFNQSILQSSVSHDPSEIILICWFGAQETFFIINVENAV